MDIQLHNTLSGKKEIFKPIKAGEVGMYNCGPTVYDSVHIGNLRSYVFADILRRTFEYNSYAVRQIVNITDVGHLVSDGDDGDDKMTKALKRNDKPLSLEAMREVGTMYFEKYVEDLKKLNIELPAEFPRASDNIAEDIEIIKLLETKGVAYKTSDGIYFDTSKFPSYGKLGKINTDGMIEGERVKLNEEKKNPTDFALWKFDTKLGWKFEFTGAEVMGFPGWHIECSAMARKYLGQPFDIHTGGIDHVSIHHNNEIAQSEVAYSTPLANYWLHNEFVNFGGAKMAKSAGGAITLESLIDESISPLAYRYWLLTSHYRSPVNFTAEAVKASQIALIRLMTIVSEFGKSDSTIQAPQSVDISTPGKIISEYQEDFNSAINNDLDTPKAVALVWELIKDNKEYSDADKYATLLDFDRVLGLNLSKVPVVNDEAVVVIPPEIIALKDAREEARKAKDWVKADALRTEIEERGYTLIDTANGVVVGEK